MKKIIIFVLCLFLNTACSRIPHDEVHGLVTITYEELMAKTKQRTAFVVYFGRPDCGDCIGFAPVLESYLDEHPDEGLYYCNLKAYRDAAKKEDARQEDIDFYETIFTHFQLSWTPTLEYIANGRIIKQYKYLDEDYYAISDRELQKERRAVFIAEFYDFMKYYKEH